ncbi:MAG: efflux RND transporter periplasmic adaptor subunit [Thioalkalispiraceae bacterium]|jgi:HlyD family secretion protein
MSQDQQTNSNRMRLILSLANSRHWRRKPVVWSIVIILIILVGLFSFLISSSQQSTTSFQTEELQQGNLTVRVTATGVLQPVNQVEVGTEISGTIESVAVDFNSRVKRGDVLARLDKERLNAQVVQARASLESARAHVEEAKATVLETKVRMNRCAKLAKQQLCSQEDLDTLTAAHVRAKSAEASARAQVAVATATLDAHQTDLDKAVIRAPIDGIVLKRQIEPGQTVAASLQTPVLFVLAESLAQMELHVAIDEADVGQVKEGQQAGFTVDAYPDKHFPAVISQVRYAPQTVEGVVTYETVLSVDNTDLLLRPGMTATAEIITKHIKNALLVPNVALRFVPPKTNQAKSTGGSLFSRLFPRPHGNQPKTRTTTKESKQVWILENGQAVAVPVKVGATDGQMTQILAGDLQAGQAVIVDVSSNRR